MEAVTRCSARVVQGRRCNSSSVMTLDTRQWKRLQSAAHRPLAHGRGIRSGALARIPVERGRGSHLRMSGRRRSATSGDRGGHPRRTRRSRRARRGPQARRVGRPRADFDKGDEDVPSPLPLWIRELTRRAFLRGVGAAGATASPCRRARRARLGGHRDRLLPVEARGDRLLRRADRAVPPDPVPRPGAPRRHLEHRRDVRPRDAARPRLPQLQLRGVPVRRARRAQRPRRHARGGAHPRRAAAAHRRHRDVPGPHQRHPVLAHGGRGALQPGDLRAERSRAADDVVRSSSTCATRSRRPG